MDCRNCRGARRACAKDGHPDLTGVWNPDGKYAGDFTKALKPGDKISLLASAAKIMKDRKKTDDPANKCLPIPAGKRFRRSPSYALVAGWTVSASGVVCSQSEPHLGRGALNLLSFQVDLWGHLRRATEASRANLLNANWNRKTVITTVVSQVATDYFQLLELDSELRISQSTLQTRQESLKLTLDREAHGIATDSTCVRPSNSSRAQPRTFRS